MEFEVLIAIGEEMSGHSRWIDESEAKGLLDWVPEVKEFSQIESSAFCFIPINQEVGAFCYSLVRQSRTIGIVENVETRIVPFPRRILSRFQDNSALLAYYCLSGGVFFDKSPGDSRFVSEQGLFEPIRWSAEFERSFWGDVTTALQIHERAVVFYGGNPIKLLASSIAQLDSERRWSLSFGYGSVLSLARPFQLQICLERDSSSTQVLAQNNIRNFEVSNEKIPLGVG